MIFLGMMLNLSVVVQGMSAFSSVWMRLCQVESPLFQIVILTTDLASSSESGFILWNCVPRFVWPVSKVC